MPCDLSAEEKIHTLTYTEWGKERFKQLVFLTSANVPAMYIDTQSGSMDYIHEKKGNEEAGTIRVYAADGEISYTGDLESIKGRGNATWTQHEKKPYSICLAVEENLLGLGKAQKWILLANAADHSNIRNKLVYDFAAQTGLPYSPNSQWVDLCLNGEYAGLYLLSEKNEIHEQRVDITPDNSYLVSIEPKKRLDEQVIPYVETSLHALRVHNPERANEETLAAIMAQLQTIENAMMSHDGIDPLSGEHFQDIADMNSWIKNYLVDEAFGNLDAFMASRYFYLDALGSKKVSAGPVWDYDLALGNDTDISWSVSNPNVQVVHRYAHEYSKTHSWAHELYEKPWFKEGLVAEFENMLPEFNYVLNTKIKEYSDYISEVNENDSSRSSRKVRRTKGKDRSE